MLNKIIKILKIIRSKLNYSKENKNRIVENKFRKKVTKNKSLAYMSLRDYQIQNWTNLRSLIQTIANFRDQNQTIET